MYGKRIIILSVLILSCEVCFSQEPVYINDSTKLDNVEVPAIRKKSFLDPSRAALLSAVLPGLGQAYNKKYWKIPIIYAGFAAGIYIAYRYNDELQFVRSELYNPDSRYATETLNHYARLYRHSRDQSIIYTFMWYALNIVDAHVDAYLKEFDVNDDLSLKLEPYFGNQYTGVMMAGLTLKLQFK